MKFQSRAVLLAAALPLSVLCGCSSIPAGEEPRRILAADVEPLPYRACLTVPDLEVATDEASKGYAPHEFVDRQALAEDLVGWLQQNDAFLRVRAPEAASAAEVFDEAYRGGDELVVEVALKDLRVRFAGHNGWWIPNIANWVFWIVPSWFVATEEYTLSFEGVVTVRSADSLRELHREQVSVEVEGTFDEFDRGWQVFGFIYPNNDADNWRRIGRALLPAARAELGRELVRALPEGLRAKLERPETNQAMTKTLAMVVGVSRYRDPVRFPPLPFAVHDARSVADALTGASGVQERHTVVLTDARATRAGVEEALGELGQRMNEGDRLVVYFASYGLRGERSQATLALHEAGEAGGEGLLPLTRLGELLAPLPGEKLVLLDTGFDGRGRSLPRSGAPRRDALRLSEAADAAVIGATSNGDVLSPQHLEGGLFTHHLVRGLRGEADLDRDGQLGLQELYSFVRAETVAAAAFFGKEQLPSGAALEREFTLPAPDRSRGAVAAAAEAAERKTK